MNIRIIPRIPTLAAVAIWVAASSSAYGTVQTFGTGPWQIGGLPVNAEATFTPGAGTIEVDLTDLLANPISSGQTLSGISFNVTGLSGSASLASSSGNVANIGSDGSYTPVAANSIAPHWGIAGSVTLSTIGIVGGQPSDLIIGPDDQGKLDGSGKYSNANSGLANFNPYVLGTGHFEITAPGVTADSVISGVVFTFGTDATPVPEPTTLIAGLLLLLPFGASTLRVLRKKR